MTLKFAGIIFCCNSVEGLANVIRRRPGSCQIGARLLPTAEVTLLAETVVSMSACCEDGGKLKSSVVIMGVKCFAGCPGLSACRGRRTSYTCVLGSVVRDISRRAGCGRKTGLVCVGCVIAWFVVGLA